MRHFDFEMSPRETTFGEENTDSQSCDTSEIETTVAQSTEKILSILLYAEI